MAVSTPTPAEAAKQSHRFGDDHLRSDRLRILTLFRRVNLASIRWSRAVFVVISLGLAGASLLATVSLTDAVSRPFRLLVDRLHTAAPEAVFVRPAVGSWMPETVLRDVDPELRPAPVAAGFSTLRSGTAQVGVLVIGGDCRLESVIGAFDCGSHMQQLSAVVGEGPSVALSSGAASALRRLSRGSVGSSRRSPRPCRNPCRRGCARRSQRIDGGVRKRHRCRRPARAWRAAVLRRDADRWRQ